MHRLRLLKLIFYKKRAFPVYLIHLITQNCNASCSHCFVQSKSNKSELSVPEIEKFCSRMGKNLYQVNLSGGEPFLRPDITKICETYIKNTPVKVIRISSNGYLVDKITEHTESILNLDPSVKIVIELSIDGIDGLHDKIRGVEGIFNHAIKTYGNLKELKKLYSNLHLNVNLTVSSNNQDFLLETYDYITKKLKMDNISITLVRGNPKEEGAKYFSLGKYEDFIKKVNNDLKRKRLLGYTSLINGNLINAQNIIARKRIVKTIKKNKFISRCYAGILGLVIESDGKVFGCELIHDELGNVKNENFEKIWLGNKARQFRKANKKCFCTHECFLTMNILFNYRYSVVLLVKILYMFLFDLTKYFQRKVR